MVHHLDIRVRVGNENHLMLLELEGLVLRYKIYKVTAYH